MQHGMADIEPGLRLHYVTAGEGPRTMVLLHGFPQTWWQWHHVIPAFAGGGFRVVAPDYRGGGHSSRPAGGYDNVTGVRVPRTGHWVPEENPQAFADGVLGWVR